MKHTKKILAILLSVILLCCLPLSAMAEASAQPQAAGSASAGDNVVKNISDLKNGEYYRIRNAVSGKYLTSFTNSGTQEDYQPGNEYQEFKYTNNGDISRFQIRANSFYLGAVLAGRAYTVANNSYNWFQFFADWRIVSAGTDGAVRIYSTQPGIMGDAICMTASDDPSNSAVSCISWNNDYQIWYFEKVVEDNVVKNADDLQNGKYYRIRNAGSGKYLEFGTLNVFQNDYNENGNQIVRYVDNGLTCEFTSYWYGNLGGTYELYNFNVVPGCRTANGTPVSFGWDVFNARPDGAMQINCVGMQSLTSMTFMTAVGDENGNNIGGGRTSDGNIILDSYSWSGSEYQLWYFEEVH